MREFLELTDDQAAEYCKGSEHQRVRKVIAGLVGAQTVLDIGCGNGIDAPTYSTWQYVGLDISIPLVRAAQKKHPNYMFMLGSADKKIPFSNRHFQCSMIKSVLEHVPSMEMVHGILKEALRVTDKTMFIAWHTPPREVPIVTQVPGHFGFTVWQNQWKRSDFQEYLDHARSVSHVDNFELWEIKAF